MSAIVSSLPISGTFPINLSSLVPGDAGGKKRRRDADEVVAFRYAFKPASITTSASGVLSSKGAIGRSLSFEVSGGNQQVFEVKEEPSKPRECALVWDETTQTFALHPLSTTLSLTLNRSASTSTRTPTATLPVKPVSTASSSSSASVPLAKRKHADSSGRDGSQHLSVPEAASKAKQMRPSESTSSAPRPSRGGKSLPRTAPMPTETRTPMKAKAKGSGKKGAKQATKAPPTSKGKLSAEIIEDSDEDYGLAEGGEAEEDEFAKMVGESLAAEGDIGWDDEDDDEDEQEDNEDEGDEFSGATVVVRDEGRVTSGVNDDSSEWL